ncbi:TetR/AcrR family transcriptional regulator [Streptomyces sp. NPDC059582]|uniref:TetR/AcrR family transcriptional regulator n=1 Tax=Streptomyces sp. NPDC059582 TaxID=3346875 RepID=UPI003693903D
MAEAASARRTRITSEREAELYMSVLDLLREVGYDALTMDAVAARTRSSKATLYRQWGGKAELVAGAIRQQEPAASGINTGSLRGDFYAVVTREDDVRIDQNYALLRGLATVVHENPDLLRALRELIIEPEIEELREILGRATERGEILPDNPAQGYLLHMLIGAFAVRSVIDQLPPTQSFLPSYIDAVVVPALGA